MGVERLEHAAIALYTLGRFPSSRRSCLDQPHGVVNAR